MDRSPAKTRLYEEFAASGKALSHASRLELLDLLSQGERSVEALARAAALNLTTASSHLQVLKQAGFVETRREGVKIYYRLAGDDVAQLLVLLRTVADRRRAEVGAARAAYLGEPVSTGIDRDELWSRINDDADEARVVLLDVRPGEEFRAGHIPGAVSIPVDELAERIIELPDDADIVVYCRGEYCAYAHDAVRTLTADGRRAIRLNDGMIEWRLAGHPVSTGP
ncbi:MULTISPECIES: metalloregulator ArsR/SmtB family transcription factor [unclassified Mycolicibacterium]|uniref:ArsR/SmtB family transcription factor n=1 Tax=unclassified Mycolicibacterium TaxID=2636767 RepID=UPI0012DDB9FA|nr:MULTISPECIES: metalloregulator ArsR/SmtB family transcription factor [unclassified Mycolicibacterium]MUL82761.1 metalloregulator ArsR/SmtB family transcription factor [Mycolicibacterium sp. CBMA 329]MUL89096.1 metalloregulator ArsR/SmtB family transcription factor [Mycolicibacterium sp. CBMA 331]MUL97663.1 metalloregulator ArsR/SmtB family transcription factor [Mycolicibacterium sp. CBMA 334]MUM28663.1 metalloregulator ArsR/SmtB family transcription factor [Mycolicibacterium sp. CBMA 295]MU